MSERSCTDIREELSAYLDGDLDARRAGEIRLHLERCGACRSELELLRLTVGALRRLPELAPPAAVLFGVRARLQTEPWHRRLLRGRGWLVGVPVSAFATLLVIVGIALFQARYPDMHSQVTRSPMPQSRPPRTSSVPQTPSPQVAAPRAPEARATRGPVPSAAPAAPVTPVTPARPAETGKPPDLDAAAAGRDDDLAKGMRAAPPVAPSGRATFSEVEQSPSAQKQEFAAEEDSLRDETQREGQSAATPSRTLGPLTETAPERALSANEYAAEPAPEGAPGQLGLASAEKPDRKAEIVSAPPPLKKESAVAMSQRTDSSAVQVQAKLAGKEKTSDAVRVVCLLLPDGDTVDDLMQLLRREGASDLAVTALDPRAVSEAFTPHRRRLASQQEPSKGWTVTARIGSRALAPLLDVLEARTTLRILEHPQPPPPPEGQAAPRELKITVLK